MALGESDQAIESYNKALEIIDQLKQLPEEQTEETIKEDNE